MRVLLGGTFEVLHAGHKKLLNRALRFSDVTIGLSTDSFARKSKRRKVLSFTKRKANLWRFFGKRASRVKIFPLEDKFGIAPDDELAEAIVVSEETKPSALKINSLRKKKGIAPLKIISVSVVLAYDGKKISSERVLSGEIDAQGRKL